MKRKVDFTVKGTKLPVIPKGTEGVSETLNDLFSFGCIKGSDKIILADNEMAKSSFYFQIPLSTIERLAEEQDMLWMEEERDWSGVRFKILGSRTFELTNKGVGKYGIVGEPFTVWTQSECDSYFSSGTWVEVKEETETSSIHVEKPNTLEDRVKALELAVFPTKRNLPVDNDDWKKFECLSFKEIVDVFLFSAGCKIELENYIKNKISKQ